MSNDQILAVSIEARINKLEREMRKASGIVGRNFDGMEKRAKRAASTIERHFSGIGTGLLAGFAGAFSARAAQQLIDASTRVTNSLKVAGLAGKDLDKVYQSLFASAQRNAAPLEALAQLYSRVSLVQGELGASTEDMLSFTDNVALALRVAGTDAQSASGALLQLSQAMGSGVIRAEEFNSILEGALPIAQAAAAGLDEAGGSVAKLRALVVDGKVSSQAFFDAFQAGSAVLQDKVAGAEMTVSASFVRLQNVLIDAAGRFNETSQAGQRFASFLDTLGTSITNLVNSPAFDSALNDLGDAISQTFANDVKDIQRVIEMVDGLAAKFDRLGTSVTDAELELAQAEQAVVNLAQNTKGQFGEVGAAFQDLVQQLLEGKGTADMAGEAITALGEANPDFANLQAKIAEVIGNFIALRDAAVAAHAAAGQTDAVGSAPTWQEFSSTFKAPTPVKPVTLADYPITPASNGSGGGGGGRASAMRAERDAAKELIAELESELRLIGTGDVAKRIDAEIRRAGSSATDAQKQSIRELVTEIERQNAAMDQMQSAMEGAKGLAKDFLGGLFSDLMNGTDAATALTNAFSRLADRLLDMALDSVINSLFSNLMGGAGGGGLLGGLFGFSDGGVVEAATGGLIRGPGTATSDSIPARLSDGEFVVRASQTAKHLDLLRAINDGSIAAFSSGGLVGDGPAVRAANDNLRGANDNGVSMSVTNNIKVEGSAGTPEQNADLSRRMAKQVENSMRLVVQQELRQAMRPGGVMRK
ncbi:tape measure protein [Devosia sp. RR2S18]|uniref:tape measure protein n=1 Tax=Devosia rhizosphaerae TaxID=3049774 RepID=UPI0025415819|nr:tape measure protein [Devosia sp. RR2S18]WIJ24225.1 tape measure protein [Devosia sp. RR2S18]